MNLIYLHLVKLLIFMFQKKINNVHINVLKILLNIKNILMLYVVVNFS